jgi:hypothetical protein
MTLGPLMWGWMAVIRPLMPDHQHYKSYKHFRRPDAAENKPFAAENKLFSAASGRQKKNRPKIRLYFWRPGLGRRK